MERNANRSSRAVLAGIVLAILSGCVTSNPERVILKGVDIDQTLRVAEDELENRRLGSVLTLWAVRDQEISPDQAREISRLYFEHVNDLTRIFNIWHLTRGISNLYRSGSDSVRAILSTAYNDAKERVAALDHKVADVHFGAEKIYRGDVHLLGRGYSRNHMVVPGNRRYLQSYKEYLSKRN